MVPCQILWAKHEAEQNFSGGVYIDRATGRDCYYWHLGIDAVAQLRAGKGEDSDDAMFEQSSANCGFDEALRR